MDKYHQTVTVFDKAAQRYQNKYMDCALYAHSLDKFCHLLISEFDHNHEDISILDIGCGPGNASLYVQDRLNDGVKSKVKVNVSGVDLSPQMIKIAQQQNPNGYFEVADIRHISDLAEGSDTDGRLSKAFNVLLCSFCIPYLADTDIEPFIQSLACVSKVKSWVYIGFMEDDYSQSCVQVSADGDQMHMYFYQSSFIDSLLVKHNFEIVSSFTKDHIVNGEKKATDRFIFARSRA
ncbi:class I SAM-dependent methyltransferase [Shewanella donghaensis]|uniref:class I SAM-dependent methyltransferase n=1 Tax=Shewanella donghaensis TaxID=238836 RepID=UPI001184625F|nr:class I SAM-dependent methyltransferase [Shewanella donghaensis]